MYRLKLLRVPKSTFFLNTFLNSYSKCTKSKRLLFLWLSYSIAISISLAFFCSPRTYEPKIARKTTSLASQILLKFSRTPLFLKTGGRLLIFNIINDFADYMLFYSYRHDFNTSDITSQ